ncbi:Ig-like domain (group 3), partial [Treponema bryantii]
MNKKKFVLALILTLGFSLLFSETYTISNSKRGGIYLTVNSTAIKSGSTFYFKNPVNVSWSSYGSQVSASGSSYISSDYNLTITVNYYRTETKWVWDGPLWGHNQDYDVYDSSETHTFLFRQDTQGPSISINNTAACIGANVEISASASDGQSGVNPGSWNVSCSQLGMSSSSNSFNFNNRPDGTYTVSFSVSDNLGNRNTVSRTYILDQTAPKVSYSRMPDDYSKQAIIQANVEESNLDTVSYSYKLNGVVGTGTGSAASLDREGKYTDFYFSAKDKVGYTGSSSKISFTVDKTPPVITVDPYTKDWTKSAVTVSATATDNYFLDTSKWKYSIDNGDKVEMSPSQDFNKVFDLDTGIHNIYIYVSDKAGNDAISEKITLKVDKVNPSTPVLTLTDPNVGGITIVNGKANKYGSSVTITPKSTDENSGISTYKFSTDQNNWTTGSSYLLNKTGSYTVYCKAVDMAGNESGTTTVEVYIDNSTPSINYTTFNSDSWFSSYKILLTANG